MTSHRNFVPFLICFKQNKAYQSQIFLSVFDYSFWDVSLNPGPVRHPCSSCLKPVAKNHRAILCDNCELWAHIKCENISTKIYAEKWPIAARFHL